MDSICSNCKYYERDYYRDNHNVMRRYPSGLCCQRATPIRKFPNKSCLAFVLRADEPEEELIIRRQELSAEVEELTGFLKKLKPLTQIVRQIQELFPPK